MDLVAPVLVLAAAIVGLAFGVEPVPEWFYPLLWWPYILALDAWTRRRTGRSLIRDDLRGFLRLALVSIAWWTLFEAINLRLGNWYYVMNPPGRAARWASGAVAFATVLPGILVTSRALEALGRPRALRLPPLRWGSAHDRVSLAVGSLFLLLPLLWPTLFYPLVWGSFFFLLAPLNRRFAAQSFLRDLQRGDAAPFVRTLMAGVACGVVWEAGNFWARNRWIYTVPGFEELKLFEMPVLGFLGFPPFAVECVAFVRAYDAARAGVARWSPGPRAAARWGAGLLAAAGTLTVFVVAEPVTNDSYHVGVAKLPSLPERARERLAAAGLETADALARALDDEAGLRRWSERAGVDVPGLRRIRARVRLIRHRGLGAGRAEQLGALGVHTLEELARWDPEDLAAALRERHPERADPFLERRVRVWLRGLSQAGGGSALDGG